MILTASVEATEAVLFGGMERCAVHCTSLPWQKPQAPICNPVSALFSPTNRDTDGCAGCSWLLPGPIKTCKTKAFISSPLTTLPTVLPKSHFSFDFPATEYCSPERNRITFTGEDFGLLFYLVGGCDCSLRKREHKAFLALSPRALWTQDANQGQLISPEHRHTVGQTQCK